MLEEYIKEQEIPYKVLKNAVLNNKVSHAYILVSNGYPKVFDFALSFAKFLLCPKNYDNSKNCMNCKQCHNIDTNNYPELKIIEPDGLWIKKEQINELQEEFKTKAIIGNKKIYIINHADKLNTIAANSILKFIEEPNSNTYAILIVDNQFQLLETIKSRCQIINLNKVVKLDGLKMDEYTKLAFIVSNTEEEINNYINDDYRLKLDMAINFVNTFEKDGIKTLLDTNRLFHCYFKEKNDIIYALEVMIIYYKDLLNHIYNRNLEVFDKHIENLEILKQKNDTNKTLKKINILLQAKQNLLYNANVSLLIDKLIIDMDRC